MKTDEVLGKTGAGPEGLPHSIIVTTEGIEGETEVVQAMLPVTLAPPTSRHHPSSRGDEDTNGASASLKG